jgi:prephenate dehydrogenase
MPDKLQISIVGLGLIGRSAGLALRRYADKVSVVGHDADPGLAGAAKKAGAVDRTDWNLIGAVIKADRILLALPPDQVRDTLKAIAHEVQQGCVIVDTADVKAPVMAWAAELLPAGVHFVGGHPIVLNESTDPEMARADLLDQKLFCLTPDAHTDAGAVQLAADLVEAMGAKPFFLDPPEHDGMAAAVEQLPKMLAVALLDVASRSSAWKDMRKLAGNQFYTSTFLTEGNGRSVATGLAANRENLLHWLDVLAARLDEWRQALSEGQEEELAKTFEAAQVEGNKWISANLRGNWDESQDTPPLPTSSTMFRDLFGFGKWRGAPDRGKKK